MMEMALLILGRKADMARKPFALVAEVESTDNLPNQNNGDKSADNKSICEGRDPSLGGNRSAIHSFIIRRQPP